MNIENHPTVIQNACVIIPTYNEEQTVGDIVRKTKQYVDTVYILDDCSEDRTREIAKQNGAQVISNQVNVGIGLNLQIGYDLAINNGFDYVIQLDGDGQHNPDFIPALFEKLNNNHCDMVIGSRFLNDSHKDYPFVRRVGISFFSFITRLITHIKITDVTSGYRIFKVDSLKTLNKITENHWAFEQTLEAGKKRLIIREISIPMPVRANGQSQFHLKRYVLYPFKMIKVITKVIIR